MLRVTDHIRKHLLASIGYYESVKLPPLQELSFMPDADHFYELMKNRLIIGSFRYGLLNSTTKKAYDRLPGIIQKLQEYKETGNTEKLVDAANCCLLEFVEGCHPKKHFFAEDDGKHIEEQK